MIGRIPVVKILQLGLPILIFGFMSSSCYTLAK